MVQPITYKNVGMSRPTDNTADLIRLQSEGFSKAVNAAKGGINNFKQSETDNLLLNMQRASTPAERDAIAQQAGAFADRARLAKALQTHEATDRTVATHEANLATNAQNREIAAAQEERTALTHPTKLKQLKAALAGTRINNEVAASDAAVTKAGNTATLRAQKEGEAINNMFGRMVLDGDGVPQFASNYFGAPVDENTVINVNDAKQIQRTAEKYAAQQLKAEGIRVTPVNVQTLAKHMLGQNPLYASAVQKGQAAYDVAVNHAIANREQVNKSYTDDIKNWEEIQKNPVDFMVRQGLTSKEEPSPKRIEEFRRGVNALSSLLNAGGYLKGKSANDIRFIKAKVTEAFAQEIVNDQGLFFDANDDLQGISTGKDVENLNSESLRNIISTGLANSRAVLESRALAGQGALSKKQKAERAAQQEAKSQPSNSVTQSIPSQPVVPEEKATPVELIKGTAKEAKKISSRKASRHGGDKMTLLDRVAKGMEQRNTEFVSSLKKENPNVNVDKVLKRFTNERGQLKSPNGGILSSSRISKKEAFNALLEILRANEDMDQYTLNYETTFNK